MSSTPRDVARGELYWIAAEDCPPPGAAQPAPGSAAPAAEPAPEAGARLAHPHLVVQDDVFNRSRVPTVIVCALTSNLHRAHEPGNVLLDEGEGDLPRRSVVVVSQIDAVDKARLGARIGQLSPARVEQVLDGLRFQQRSYG